MAGKIKSEHLNIELLINNTGQINGLPKNPRVIRNEKYRKLVKSIKDDPEMLEVRECIVYPLEGKYIVIGGNMRLKVLKELEYKMVPCKILPVETPIAKLRSIAIKDNVNFGEHDWDLLANDWDPLELNDYGIVTPNFDSEPLYDDVDSKQKENFRVVINCESEEEQNAIYTKLIELGFNVQAI